MRLEQRSGLKVIDKQIHSLPAMVLNYKEMKLVSGTYILYLCVECIS